MSTSCLIGYLMNPQDKCDKWQVKYVYCHWDGYPNYTGKILYEDYNTLSKVKELVNLGDFSSLENTVEKTREECYNESDLDKPKIMPYNEYVYETRYGGVDYVYLYDTEYNYWRMRPTLGYDLGLLYKENLLTYF